MKKAVRIFSVTSLAAVLVLAGVGCSSKEKASSASAQPGSSASASVSQDTSADVSVPSSDGDASSPDTSAAKDFLAIGATLMDADGIGPVKINLTESALVKLLGQPTSKTAPELWGADGLEHSTWAYDAKGLHIDMAAQPDDGEAIVFSISAASPCDMATHRGIKIGTPKDQVLTAYADSIDSSVNPDTGAQILIGSVYGGIAVDISNGVVTSIFIGASAE